MLEERKIWTHSRKSRRTENVEGFRLRAMKKFYHPFYKVKQSMRSNFKAVRKNKTFSWLLILDIMHYVCIASYVYGIDVMIKYIDYA